MGEGGVWKGYEANNKLSDPVCLEGRGRGGEVRAGSWISSGR